MVIHISGHRQLMSISFAIACIAVPLGAYAAGPVRTPTYAHDSDAIEVIYGRITSFDGRYSLQLRDDRGFFDNVEMVQGTIINPTGQRLKADMRVAVRGPNRGFALIATQIDTQDIPPVMSARLEPVKHPNHIRPPGPNRERQRLAAERLRRYRAEQEAYHRAQAAYSLAEKAKAKAAAQRLASKLARLHGGQGWPTAFHRHRKSIAQVARRIQVPAARRTFHNDMTQTRVPPPKRVAPIRHIDPAIAHRQSMPPWFGWGKL